MPAKNRWASDGDILLFLQGWEMGKEFSLGTSYVYSEKTRTEPA